MELWEPPGEGQGQAQLWDLGPWPQFPCFKAQDFVPGSGSSTAWAEAREGRHHSLCGDVWRPGSDHPHRGFSSQGTCRLGGCPAFKDSRKFKPQAFLLPGKGDWKWLECGPSGRSRLQACITRSMELSGFSPLGQSQKQEPLLQPHSVQSLSQLGSCGGLPARRQDRN